MIGASAALALSGLPIQGPIGAARVGYADGKFLLNPRMSELKTSQLDLVVAGTEDAVLMFESEARELPEAVMLDAVMFGHQQMQTVIKAIKEMAADVGKPRWDWQAVETDKAIKAAVRELAAGAIAEAYRIAQQQDRQNRLAEIRQDVLAKMTTATEGGGAQFFSVFVCFVFVCLVL